MTPPLPVEVAMIKAVAEIEAKHGTTLTEREKLLCQTSFCMGHGHGLQTGTAIFDQVLAERTKA